MPLPPEATDAEKAAYDKGFKDALDHRRMYVSFGDEVNMPLEWEGYTDREEREAIAAVVECREWQDSFKQNLTRQAMLKWRQARQAKDNPQKVHFLFLVGDAIMDLIEFYEHAKDRETPTVDTTGHGYDSSLTEL